MTLPTVPRTVDDPTGPEYLEAVADNVDALKYYIIQFSIGDGSTTITTGIKHDLQAPYDGQIEEATALANETGSIAVALWKDTYANYPPTSGDSIVASAPISISSGVKSKDTTLTGWSKSVVAGDIFRVNVNSVTSIKRCTIYLKVRRT